MSNVSDSGNFIVTVHALERFEERFPTLWENDPDAGELIHGECLDAMAQGRTASVAPLELAHHDLSRWQAGKCFYAWTPNKTRGYVLSENEGDMTVVTVLKGKTSDDARRMLYEGRRPRKGEDADPTYEAATG